MGCIEFRGNGLKGLVMKDPRAASMQGVSSKRDTKLEVTIMILAKYFQSPCPIIRLSFLAPLKAM